jgi:hypothetical protein
MIWLSLLLGVSAWSAPLGDSSSEAIEAALQAELVRSRSSLSLTNAPSIYHLRYHVLDMSRISLLVSLGDLVQRDTAPLTSLAVEVRVGSPDFDNTGFVGWQNGFVRTSLPMVPTDFNVSQSAWRATDRAYKQAVEQFSRKSAQFSPPENYPGDYWLGAPVRVVEPRKPTLNVDELEAMSVRLSEGLVLEGGVELGEIHLGYEGGTHLMVDSEGSSVTRSLNELTVRAISQVRAADGALVTDHRTWSVEPVEGLPEEAEMAADISAMMANLTQAQAAEPFEGEYVGPVLFEHEAALDLFRYILIPQLEGTPPEVPFDSWFGKLGSSNDPVRVGRRVLPAGWSVTDDPQKKIGPGYFKFDLEGSPSKRVSLVEEGIVRTVLMSRIPRKGMEGSTGHARGYPGDRAEARASQLAVSPSASVSLKKLKKHAISVASSYGRDWVYVVRRLQDPAVMAAGRSGWGIIQEGPSLPPPVVLYRLYANGEEEPVRSARFANISRWLLRDILKAGPSMEACYLASLTKEAYFSSPVEGLPTCIEAPALLIGELELVASPGDPKEIRILDLAIK